MYAAASNIECFQRKIKITRNNKKEINQNLERIGKFRVTIIAMDGTMRRLLQLRQNTTESDRTRSSNSAPACFEPPIPQTAHLSLPVSIRRWLREDDKIECDVTSLPIQYQPKSQWYVYWWWWKILVGYFKKWTPWILWNLY